MDDVDLSLVETQALVAELFKRFDHAVFAAMKDQMGGKQVMFASAYGNPFLLAGMCQLMSSDGLEKWQINAHERPPHDL